MNAYNYKVQKDEALKAWVHSELNKEKVNTEIQVFDAPVNMTEGYQEIEYPVRREFLETLKNIEYPAKINFNEFYYGFENPRVDFSTFQAIPQKLSTFLFANISIETSQLLDFQLTTCGRVIIWLNGQKIEDYKPYTRNHGTMTNIQLPFEAGNNELVVYMDDLAERDVNFFLELTLKSDVELNVSLPLDFETDKLKKGIEFLEGLYLEQDIYKEGLIRIGSDYSHYDKLLLTYNSLYFSEEGSGNITDFERADQELILENNFFVIGNSKEISTSGLTQMYVGVKLSDQRKLYKKLTFSIYNPEKMQASLGDTLDKRKQEALARFAKLDLNDMNSALAELALGETSLEKVENKLKPAYQMIETRGDCADFMFAPLLSFVKMNGDKLPTTFTEKIKRLALDFRYWIDEPGNDVMWYFSENHSLLFHTCQYFAGDLYQDELFVTSQRTGKKQYEIGKERLIEWFETFKKYGFSEWNSTTYLPIDLIGFFSLYNSAPDEEIKQLAKEALDFSFKIIAINYHGRTMSSTFGRTYEHDLKAMRSGEISNILAIAWDCGNFNNALRASTLFCLSDYEPPKEYADYIFLEKNNYLTANYIQGINKVETYLYKCNEYSIASAIGYNAFKKGHQQHMMNISLGSQGTQLWINNPGEYMHSGENRPSYWAGNSSCPDIKQVKNEMSITYDLSEAYIKMIHLYLPFWDLSEIIVKNANCLFVRKETSYLAVYFSNGFRIEDKGDTRNREVVSLGTKHNVFIKCSSENEVGSFERFIDEFLSKKDMISLENDSQVANELTYAVVPKINYQGGIENE